MDPEKVKQKDGKASQTNDVAVEQQFLASNYEFKSFPHSPISRTGPLRLFELLPKHPGFPSFIGRWDDAADSVDVDIRGVSRVEESRFRNGADGYEGHHRKRSGPDRTFKIEIADRGGVKIFVAELSLGLGREFELREVVHAEVACEAVVSREKPEDQS